MHRGIVLEARRLVLLKAEAQLDLVELYRLDIHISRLELAMREVEKWDEQTGHDPLAREYWKTMNEMLRAEYEHALGLAGVAGEELK
jgi:hypothetical protein